MANDANRYSVSYDSNLLLKDAGLVAASGVAQVSGSNALIDVGDGVFEGIVVIDVTAVETDSSNELYTITLQGGTRDTTSTRDNPVIAAGTLENLAMIDMGHTSVRKGGAKTSSTGRYYIWFRNVENDTTFQILRLYTTVAGTVATGINYTAFIGKIPY